MNIIKKTKQRLSQTYLVKEQNNHYFVKKYQDNYPKMLIKTEFEKSKKIYSLLKKNDYVKTPKPLKIDMNNRSITFEFIPNCHEIKFFFLKNNNIFYKDKRKIKESVLNITKAIAYIHKNLKLKNPAVFNYNKIKERKPVPLLADLCNSNILIQDKRIYLIDFSPSQYMFPFNTCNILGSCYFDLVHLIYSFKLPPLFYRLVYNFNLEYLEKVIITTYFSESKKKFNKNDLIQAKIYYLKKYLSSLKNHKLTYWWWKKIIKKELAELENGKL